MIFRIQHNQCVCLYFSDITSYSCPFFALPQRRWPSYFSLDVLGRILPQGICICCIRCLVHSFLAAWISPSVLSKSLLICHLLSETFPNHPTELANTCSISHLPLPGLPSCFLSLHCSYQNLTDDWKLLQTCCCSVSKSYLNLRAQGLQHSRLPCPLLFPRVCANSCPLCQWCHLALCHPLLLLPSVFPITGVFSNESALPIRWPEYWSFSFSISPSNEYSVIFLWDWLIWSCSPRDSQESSARPQFESISSLTRASLWSSSHVHTWLLKKTIAFTI